MNNVEQDFDPDITTIFQILSARTFKFWQISGVVLAFRFDPCLLVNGLFIKRKTREVGQKSKFFHSLFLFVFQKLFIILKLLFSFGFKTPSKYPQNVWQLTSTLFISIFLQEFPNSRPQNCKR